MRPAQSLEWHSLKLVRYWFDPPTVRLEFALVGSLCVVPYNLIEVTEPDARAHSLAGIHSPTHTDRRMPDSRSKKKTSAVS